MVEEEVEDEDMQLNDDEEDEYDQEDPEDDNFLVGDDEVLQEELEA